MKVGNNAFLAECSHVGFFLTYICSRTETSLTHFWLIRRTMADNCGGDNDRLVFTLSASKNSDLLIINYCKRRCKEIVVKST